MADDLMTARENPLLERPDSYVLDRLNRVRDKHDLLCRDMGLVAHLAWMTSDERVWSRFASSREELCLKFFGKTPDWLDILIEIFLNTDRRQFNRITEADIDRRLGNQNAAKPELTARIQELREQGLTQREIGEQVGVDRSAVARHLARGVQNEGNNYTPSFCTPPASSTPKGTSKAALLKRLKRVDPSIELRIGKGKEFKSVYAAAVSHGLVKPPAPTITLSSPEQAARAILEKLAASEIAHLIECLLCGLEPPAEALCTQDQVGDMLASLGGIWGCLGELRVYLETSWEDPSIEEDRAECPGLDKSASADLRRVADELQRAYGSQWMQELAIHALGVSAESRTLIDDLSLDVGSLVDADIRYLTQPDPLPTETPEPPKI